LPTSVWIKMYAWTTIVGLLVLSRACVVVNLPCRWRVPIVTVGRCPAVRAAG
jgi:hypothetical protein